MAFFSLWRSYSLKLAEAQTSVVDYSRHLKLLLQRTHLLESVTPFLCGEVKWREMKLRALERELSAARVTAIRMSALRDEAQRQNNDQDALKRTVNKLELDVDGYTKTIDELNQQILLLRTALGEISNGDSRAISEEKARIESRVTIYKLRHALEQEKKEKKALEENFLRP